MKKQTKITQEKPRFKTNYNGYRSNSDFEKVDPVSITVPNEAYSLKDIIDKFSREYPKNLLRNGYFDQEFDGEDFEDIDPTRQPDFDLVDAYELREQINEKKKPVKQVKNSPELDQVENESQKAENQPNAV